jgi:hypothetical protein
MVGFKREALLEEFERKLTWIVLAGRIPSVYSVSHLHLHFPVQQVPLPRFFCLRQLLDH